MNQEDDLEKLSFYLAAKFELHESVFLPSLVINPSYKEIKDLFLKLKKNEIERLYNHFHMSAISENLIMQKEYALVLWSKWRMFFDREMPERNIIIEISDQKCEIIIYIYDVT